MGLNKEFNFKQYLIDNTEGYSGKFAKYLLLLPDLYDTLNSILSSEEISQSLRSDIYLTIGYLFHADDIFSEEEHGTLGFIDDLMLILVVLRKCAQQIGIEFIEERWSSEYSLEQLLTSDFDDITMENIELFDELLTVTGIENELYLA